MGSILPVLELPLIGSAPSTIRCLSVSDVITCNPFVGTKFAPDTADNCTALVDKPSFSTQRNILPPLGLIIRSSPKLSCVHNRSWFVSDSAVEDPQAPAPHVPTPQPVDST